MTDKTQALQEEFLDNLVKTGKSCNVYLMNGIRLVGAITAHDRFVIIVGDRSRQQQLVYKHAISTIAPTTSGS